MKIISSIKQKLGHYSWDLAYGEFTDSIFTDGLQCTKIHVVKNPYKNKWFADPFILEDDGNIIQLLVEEFDYSIGRGRIARIAINKSTNKIVECSIILDLPTHLSFPAIYHVENNVYVHPENSASGASYIYRYDQEADKLIEQHLMIEEPLVDAIICKDKEIYRMYATQIPDSNGCRLLEYTSNCLFGPYKYTSEYTFRKNSARMAGKFLERQKGQSIRPAQDCFGGYGNAVIFYDNCEEICRLIPDLHKYAGIHTFNTFNGTFIIDLKKYDYTFLYRLLRFIKK